MSVGTYRVRFVPKKTDYAPKRAPGKTQAMVLTHRLRGRSGPWIARRLGVTTTAVYAHLARLRASGQIEDRDMRRKVS